jgi:integrase
VGEIDRETAQGYAAWLESLGLSGKSFNDNIAMVSVVIRALSKEAGLDENPFDSIRRKSQEITHKKELSEAEALRLLDVFNNPAFNVMHKEELRLCFHLGMFSGLRFSDAVNLRFSQVSLADNLIRMKPAKTRRTSGITITVPIHPFLRSMIEDAERGRQEGEDFITPNLAKRFSYNKTGLNKDVIKVFEAAGFETREENKGVRAVNVYGFHSFRSTFCSFAARKGVPLSTLAQITGDNIQTLQKYYVRIDEKTAAQTLSALPMMKPALPAPPDTPAGKEAEARQALKELVDTADFKTVQKALKLFKAGRA